jgi:hypothetical protein
MDQLQTPAIPQVYVLWHPRCPLGEPLAKRIYEWLRPGNGLGPEVFYRSLPAPRAPLDGLPPLLPDETRFGEKASPKQRSKFSNLHILLPLIDENMVASMTWGRWLEDLMKSSAIPRTILPVALDATAYNMPATLRVLNYLRPSGLPLPAGAGGAAFEMVVRSLLKQVTEALCAVMLPRPAAAATAPSAAPPPKINVFLSHAKQDGTVPARRLRDYIYSQTQLAAFYDENDIAFGSSFASVIQKTLVSQDTAALVACRSTRYAGRPWCRREVSLFRKPRKSPQSPAGPERWQIYPSLVVEAMEGREFSPGIPEFGNSPVIRWNSDDRGMEELIITTVIRDAMLASYHAALGAKVPATANQIVINWIPDPTTLLHIPAIRSGTAECAVFYPGRGLSGLDLDALDEFFPRVTFHCFEDVLTTGLNGAKGSADSNVTGVPAEVSPAPQPARRPPKRRPARPLRRARRTRTSSRA